MLLVGLTGGLASGKSTVSRMLEERGAVVVDADELARDAVAPGTPGLARVAETFGASVIAPDGSLDRTVLASIVFGDESARRKLEAIVHPEVFRILTERVGHHRGTHRVVVFDAPLIVETGFDRACDALIVVVAPLDVRISRVVARGMEPADARARISAQVNEEERASRADFVITNEGSLEDLERQVDSIWPELERRAAEA